jgi:Trypsin-co-occurring domain 1
VPLNSDGVGASAAGADGEILVQVVPTQGGRQISWGSGKAELLAARVSDLRAAIESGVSSLSESIPSLTSPAGWQLSEFKGTFGITLAAEAGVILSKASAEAAFDVEITFKRRDDDRVDPNPG